MPAIEPVTCANAAGTHENVTTTRNTTYRHDRDDMRGLQAGPWVKGLFYDLARPKQSGRGFPRRLTMRHAIICAAAMALVAPVPAVQSSSANATLTAVDGIKVGHRTLP